MPNCAPVVDMDQVTHLDSHRAKPNDIYIRGTNHLISIDVSPIWGGIRKTEACLEMDKPIREGEQWIDVLRAVPTQPTSRLNIVRGP